MESLSKEFPCRSKLEYATSRWHLSLTVPEVESRANCSSKLGYNGLTGSQAYPMDRTAKSDMRDAESRSSDPFNPTGVSTTASRALIFVCDPKTKEESACARQITENLARRRRSGDPLAAEDVKRLMPFYEAGRRDGGTFDQGIEQVVAAVLVSPQFLYRALRGPNGTAPDTEFTLTDLELASRLSFFLWNTGPDEELLTLASANGLTRAGVLEKQVKRMLADPKASSLVTSFAMKWLALTNLEQVIPDPKLFPEFDERLRNDFSMEAEAFIGSIFSEDRSVLELLTADYTFLNERLARHYGISGVLGDQFRKVTLLEGDEAGPEGGRERWGLRWVKARCNCGLPTATALLRCCAETGSSISSWAFPSTPPPPDTATDLSQKAGEQPKTVRARLEQHRNKATLPDVPRRDRSNRVGFGEFRCDSVNGGLETVRRTLLSMPALCCRTESRSMASPNSGRNWSTARQCSRKP